MLSDNWVTKQIGRSNRIFPKWPLLLGAVATIAILPVKAAHGEYVIGDFVIPSGDTLTLVDGQWVESFGNVQINGTASVAGNLSKLAAGLNLEVASEGSLSVADCANVYVGGNVQINGSASFSGCQPAPGGGFYVSSLSTYGYQPGYQPGYLEVASGGSLSVTQGASVRRSNIRLYGQVFISDRFDSTPVNSPYIYTNPSTLAGETFEVASGSLLTIVNGAQASSSDTMQIAGQVSVSGNRSELSSSNALQVDSGGTLTLADGASAVGYNNVQINGSTTVVSDANVGSNLGNLSVGSTGSLTVEGGYAWAAGDVRIFGQASVSSGQIFSTSNTGSLEVASTGSLTVTGGDVGANGDVHINGQASVAGASLSEDMNLRATSLTAYKNLEVASGGLLTISDAAQAYAAGDLVINGQASVTGAKIYSFDDGRMGYNPSMLRAGQNLVVASGATLHITDGATAGANAVLVNGQLSVTGGKTTDLPWSSFPSILSTPGRIDVTSNASIIVDNAQIQCAQTFVSDNVGMTIASGASVVMNQGSIFAGYWGQQAKIINDGQLTGNGYIAGDVLNRGNITVSSGSVLSVNGGFQQETTGSLSLTDNTWLSISDGHLVLHGQLNVDFLAPSWFSDKIGLISFNDANPDIRFDRIYTTGLSSGITLVPYIDAGVFGLKTAEAAPVVHSNFADSQDVVEALSGFSSQTDPVFGEVALVQDSLLSGQNVLSLKDTGTEGDRTVSITRSVDLQQLMSIAFGYRFLTEGKLQIIIGDQVVDTIYAPLDVADQLDSGRDFYAQYSATYDLALLGLTGTHDFTLKLSNVGDPEVLLDGLDIGTVSVPEPATLGLFAIGAGGLLLRRRPRKCE